MQDILTDLGVNAKMSGFKYTSSDGVVSKNLELYSLDPATPEKLCAQFQQVSLDFDGKLVTKGTFSAEKLTLRGGTAWVDLHDEENNRILIEDLNCVLNLTRGYDVIIEECTAKLGGIAVDLKGELLGIREPRETKGSLEVPEVLRDIFREVYQITASKSSPPTAKVYLYNKYKKEVRVDVDFQSEAISYRQLDFIKASGKLKLDNKILYVNDFKAQDDSGHVTGTGKYFTETRTGTFDLDSTTNLPKIVRNFNVDSFVDKLVSPLPPALKAKGTIKGYKDEEDRLRWKLQTHGHVKLDEFRLLGTNFNSLDTDFSWREGTLFLRDMKVDHDEGAVEGKILISKNDIRYEATSDLPITLYEPFIKKESNLAKTIAKADFKENSSIQLNLNGSMNREQLNQWEASGDVVLKELSYNEVPVKKASGEFVFTPVVSEFKDVEVVFDYSKYIPSRFAINQPSTGVVIAEKITYDSEDRVVDITELGGKAWVAPVINLFAKRVGTYLDNTVYFIEPPTFSSNGSIGVKGNTDGTDLKTKILLPINVHYTFLGKDLEFEEFDALVNLRKNSVFINDIDTYALGGHLKGDLRVDNKHPLSPLGGYTGEISFTQISLTDLAEVYEFETATPGILTGRVEFNGLPDNVRALNGKGFISLDKADLFYIPVFGPLSPIMSGILGSKKTTHEQVRNLSASYLIKSGKVLTNDLSTQTPSAKITGDGVIDLKTQEIDMTVRTSTKGLLGVITLPIKPLEKLLQFRGTGTVQEPKWVFSPGSSTPKYLPEKEKATPAIIVE